MKDTTLQHTVQWNRFMYKNGFVRMKTRKEDHLDWKLKTHSDAIHISFLVLVHFACAVEWSEDGDGNKCECATKLTTHYIICEAMDCAYRFRWTRWLMQYGELRVDRCWFHFKRGLSCGRVQYNMFCIIYFRLKFSSAFCVLCRLSWNPLEQTHSSPKWLLKMDSSAGVSPAIRAHHIFFTFHTSWSKKIGRGFHF